MKRLSKSPSEKLSLAAIDPLHSSSPILLTALEAAALCGKSLRTWRAWDSQGVIPQPVRIGRSTLWRTEELMAWIAAGCPRRAEWEAQHHHQEK